MKGKRSWNSGLTKETDERVLMYTIKQGNSRRGKKINLTDNTRNILAENCRKNFKGKKKTEEHKEKIRKNNTGKKVSKETREKLKLCQKNIKKEIVICPHCLKQGGKPAMYRHHFNNCKSNIDNIN